MLAPAGHEINVVKAFDAKIDAWRGARTFVQDKKVENIAVSRAEYEECGHNYLKEHGCSNYAYGK